MAPAMTRLAVIALAAACASAGGGGESTEGVPPSTPATGDSSPFLVPAGYGSLRQDDIAIRLQVLGLQVQAIPLDETVTRVLSPDAYRAMREVVESQRTALETLRRRTALPRFSLWDVRFFGLQPGETPFSPSEFVVTSVGRDFRPIEVLPLTPGFGSQRLRQRELQRAVYVFDPQVDVNQPLTVQFQTARSAEWALILLRIERERALVRSRAGIKP